MHRDPIHPLTGPIFVEGAEPGDVLAVTLHEIETGDRGWTAIAPGFGFLAEESLVGDLEIAEVVDVPNVLVAMHLPKHVFVNATGR